MNINCRRWGVSLFAALLIAIITASMTIYAENRSGRAGANAAAAISAQTDVTPSIDFAFGGICIGRGQTASIIAVLLPDPSGRDQRPVQVEFLFHDWDGNLLASETKTILPGHASPFDIRSGVGIPGRSELSPCIKVLVDPADPIANRIVGTLEISDTSTGKAQSLFMRKSGGDPNSAGKPW
jgi:hypothetical protein